MKITSLLIIMLIVLPPAVRADEHFDLISNLDQVHGCWKRVVFSDEVMERMNKIDLYPVEMKHQWYCFLEDNDLFTMHSNRDDNLSLPELIKKITIFPSVEKYSMPAKGVILIHHKDMNQTTPWLTSVVVKKAMLDDNNELRKGDLLMTIRNFETGEDLYYRQLRKLK